MSALAWTKVSYQIKFINSFSVDFDQSIQFIKGLLLLYYFW